MVKVASSVVYEDTYASEYIRGVFDKATFMKYKGHNIAIIGVELKPDETVVIEELSNWRSFWDRDYGHRVVTKYKQLSEKEIKGVGFEIYEVVGD